MHITKFIVQWIVINWLPLLSWLTAFAFVMNRLLGYQYGKYVKYVQNIHGYILIGGAFNKGKTRLLSLLAREARHIGKFIITNFSNGYNHLRFSSLKDFQLLLNDIMVISEYQNYGDDEIDEVYAGMGKKYMTKKRRERAILRVKYPYIPFNGEITEFFLGGDEWHAYFYSRNAMSNFAGENRDFNITLHQARHFNLQGVFATQELDDLDKKFRTLATYEIETYEKLGGALMGWDIYSYNSKRKYDEEEKQYFKINRLPVITANGYVINKMVQKLNFRVLMPLAKELSRFKIKIDLTIKKVYYQLRFHSKSNVNPTLDIYDKGALFKAVNEFYKSKLWDVKLLTNQKKVTFDKLDKKPILSV